MDDPPFLEVWRCSVVVVHFLNYPEVASEVSARDLACWLHSLYCKLDVVVQKHEEHHGHNTSVAAVGLALELVEAVHELTLPSGAPLCCRVAVSTGKAAAAITGTAAWSFQLYGKTLEKAKAVVQAGPVGVLQLTGDVVAALPNPSSFSLHRSQPEFGGMGVYLQAPPSHEQQLAGRGEPLEEWRLALVMGVQQLSRSLSCGALKAAGILSAATRRLQFQDPTLEDRFRQAWNTKLYQQDLWAFAILAPLLLVACLVLPPAAMGMPAVYGWAPTGLTAALVLVWAYRPAFYIRRRFLLLALFRATHILLFLMPRHPHPLPFKLSSLQSIAPPGALLFNAMALSMQVQFDHQVLLHLAAYAATMAGVFGTCGAMDSASKMHLQCTVVGSVLYAWLNFVVGVIVPLTACSVIERGARLAFLTAPKAHAHKSA